MNTHNLLGALALAALTAACGGGGSDGDPVAPPPVVVDNDVPASAMASNDAFTRYAAGLPASESAEPVSLDKLVPPSSETAEPLEI